MFMRIDIECVKSRMSKKELAKKINMKYDTLLSKLKCKTEFTRAEMLSIQNAFPTTVSLEELFATDEKRPHKAS